MQSFFWRIGCLFREWYIALERWRFSKRIKDINEQIEYDQEEISVELFHRILSTIPIMFLTAIHSKQEEEEVCTIRNYDIGNILQILDQAISFIEVEQYNNHVSGKQVRKKYPRIETRKYPIDWHEYSLDSLLYTGTGYLSSAQLHAELVARTGRMIELLDRDPLQPHQQSYLDRMTYVVLEDCYVLISSLVGLSLNARIKERSFEVGQDRRHGAYPNTKRFG